ncbi:Gfo/Idh/MocA family oxidoreductase [Salibacteraceae bacterium]|jgi:UDP-N-acetyl-2-amino-2-deoxyglucuronate dehydrogenase|nr:Gfo/Idh/MocA family oxidoreductase [Salibacteraceae bacterium]MDB9709766.1 Gfo/Idh/MocA family oxidoreductase [Salibacteraceae bacterium]HAQ69951.1 oxidoreductase [Flavobacteriales bacterium]
MGKITFGVIGFGHIGKKHALMVSGNAESELKAVVDTDAEKLNQAKELYPNIQVFESIEDLIEANLDLNVVNVCTPNGLHAAQSIKMLESRSHVVIEKPMGLTRQECEEVIFKSLQVSRHVFCVKQNRYSPSSKWLKSLIAENKLGKINMVQLSCYWNRDERYYKAGGWKGTNALDGGVLFTQFSHFVDIMYWLFGDIQNIIASSTNFGHENITEFDDSGLVQFEFVNGGFGSINYSTAIWDKNFESSIVVVGEKGTVKVSGQYMDKVEYCHIENYTMPDLPPSNPPNDYGDYKGSAANHHYVIENVVDVLTGKSQISTNALEGMKVVEMIERIHRKQK